MKHIFFYSLFLYLSISCVFAQSSLLKDINTSNASSHPRHGVDANGTVFFITGENGSQNIRLWKTDGTNVGTLLTKDPYSPANRQGPFFYHGSVPNLTKFNNSVVFSASSSTNTNDTELWISDGTTNGTLQVKDINVGSGGSNPNNFYQFGSKVVFTANNGTNGDEPWITDGTAANTFMLKDINTGSGGSFIGGFVAMGSFVYFWAYNPTYGVELWKTDGTTAGTVLVQDYNSGANSTANFFEKPPVASDGALFFKLYVPFNYGVEFGYYDGFSINFYDINSGTNSSNPSEITIWDNSIGKVAFVANDGSSNKLYMFNMLSLSLTDLGSGFSVNPFSNPKDLTKVGNNVFFTADQQFGGGRALYLTYGDFNNTTLVKDINTVSNTGDEAFPSAPNTDQRVFMEFNGQLIFVANDGTNGFELWKSNGSSGGTTMIKHLNTSGNTTFSYFVKSSNLLYFIANDTNGFTAWKTDATTANTVAINTLSNSTPFEYPYPICASGTTMYFAAYGSAVGYELFKTDGTTSSLVKDITTNPFSLNLSFLKKATVGNVTVFAYSNNKNGLELWRTTGKTAETYLLKEFTPYPVKKPLANSLSVYDFYSGSAYFDSDFYVFQNEAYFKVNNQLWKTDGTNATLLATEASGFTVSTTYFAELNAKLYFNFGNQLWETNGTVAGTILVKNIDNPIASIFYLTACNGLLFFSASDNTYGEELWKSNGTAAGTTIVKELTAGINWPSYSYRLKAVGNTLFFSFYDTTVGSELWKTDGTAAGTVLVKDINSGINSSSIDYMKAFNNQLLFYADDGVNGWELWKSDGTTGGTALLKDINVGSEGSYGFILNGMQDFDEKVFFLASNGVDTNNLYQTDGTTAGTISIPVNLGFQFISTANSLYANASEATNGNELWKSDGTSAGTYMLKNINTGSAGSNPNSFHNGNGLLFFIANNGTNGDEIHVVKDCRDNLTLTGNVTTNNTQEVGRSINSTQNIQSNFTNYYSRGSVLLNPGFKTISGAKFLAQIGGCVFDPAN